MSLGVPQGYVGLLRLACLFRPSDLPCMEILQEGLR